MNTDKYERIFGAFIVGVSLWISPNAFADEFLDRGETIAVNAPTGWSAKKSRDNMTLKLVKEKSSIEFTKQEYTLSEGHLKILFKQKAWEVHSDDEDITVAMNSISLQHGTYPSFYGGYEFKKGKQAVIAVFTYNNASYFVSARYLSSDEFIPILTSVHIPHKLVEVPGPEKLEQMATSSRLNQEQIQKTADAKAREKEALENEFLAQLNTPNKLSSLGKAGWEQFRGLVVKVNSKNGYGDRGSHKLKKGAYISITVTDETLDGRPLGAHLSQWELNKKTGLYTGLLTWTEEVLGGHSITQIPVFSRVPVPLRRFQYFCLRMDDDKEFKNEYGETKKLSTAYVVGVSGGNNTSNYNPVLTEYIYDPVELKRLRQPADKKENQAADKPAAVSTTSTGYPRMTRSEAYTYCEQMGGHLPNPDQYKSLYESECADETNAKCGLEYLSFYWNSNEPGGSWWEELAGFSKGTIKRYSHDSDRYVTLYVRCVQ